MKNEINFALYAIKKNLQSSAELRGSFIANILGMVINNFAFILSWLFMIQTVGVIGGWDSSYVFGANGFTALAFGICFSIFGGLSDITRLIGNGGFDRFLLSPKNIILRVSTSSIKVAALGDILFGVICLAICGLMNSFTSAQILITLFLCPITSLVFMAFILFAQTLSFYFSDGEPITNGALELFLTPALMHGGAFQDMMRFIFIFAIPSLVIGTLPVEAVINLDMNKILIITVVAVVWIVFTIIFFYRSLRRYESANFMTFGS